MTSHRVTSILLCALLSSTLGHEYLRVKRFAPEARKSIIQSPFQERTSDIQGCSIVCNNQTDQGLQLYVNVTASLVAVLNVTANVALIIDYSSNLIGLFNGNSGVIIIINIKTNSGVYITANDSNKVWLKASQSFEVYFQSLISLQYFVDLHVGTTFQIETVSTEIATLVGQLLVLFSAQLKYEIQANVKVSLSILLKIGVSFTTLLQGSLNGFLQFAGAGAITLHGDIVWFIAVFQGFGAFFGQISGGLAALINAGVVFDLTLLFGASTGIEVFINLLLAISEKIDLSIFAGFLNSTEAFFVLIAQLGGYVSYGTSGIFKVIANIIQYTNGHIQIDVLLQTLIEFSAYNSGSIDLQIYWQGLVKIVEIVSASSSSSLSGFISIVTNLQKGTLIVNGVNISQILVILSNGTQTSIVLCITILFRISAIIQVVISIPLLFFKLILYLNTYYGVVLLNNLGFKITISGSGSIITQILAGFNISTLTQFILSGFQLTDVLPRLPVIGTIYVSFQSAVKIASDGTVTFSSLLTSSTSLSLKIKAYLKGILNLGPKTTEPTTTPTFGDENFETIWNTLGNTSVSGSTGTASGGSGGVTVSNGGGGGVSGSVGGGGSWGWSLGSGGGASGSEGGSVTVSAGGGATGSEGSSGSGSVVGGSSGSVGGGSSGSAGGSGFGSAGGSGSGSAGGSGSGSAGGSGSGSSGGSGSGSSGGGGSGSAGGSGSGSVGGGSSGSVGGTWGWSLGSGGESGGSVSGTEGSNGTVSAGSGGSGSAGSGGSGSAGSGGSGSVGGGSSGSWGWSSGGGSEAGVNGSAVGGESESGGPVTYSQDTGSSDSAGGGVSGSAGGSGGSGGSWGWGGGVSSGGSVGGSADAGDSVDGGDSASWSVKHKSVHHKQPEKERKQQKSEHQN